MSDTPTPEPGSILWVDLTVPEAEEIRDFYAKVVGWKPDPVDMGEYSDYSMKSPKSDMPTAGVCHARGVNKDLPPYWLVYITVNDLDQSMKDATRLGGQIVVSAKGMGGQGRYCVIQDPAGAVVALFEPAEREKQ